MVGIQTNPSEVHRASEKRVHKAHPRNLDSACASFLLPVNAAEVGAGVGNAGYGTLTSGKHVSPVRNARFPQQLGIIAPSPPSPSFFPTIAQHDIPPLTVFAGVHTFRMM